MQHIVGVVVGEGEAGPFVSLRVERLDRVDQSADLAHQRDAAVAHRNQLADTAGLFLRWHQQQVGTGVDAAGQRIVVTDVDGNPTRITLCCIAEKILLLRFAGAEHR